MSEPRRHHTLPQFYQRRFADENERIVGVRRDDLSRRVETSPANLAVRRDYYTIDRDDGQRDTGVETTVLAKHVEGFAAQALRRIHVAGGFPVPVQDKEDIGLFLAFQMLRGPEHRERLDEFTQRALATAADLMPDEAISARLAKGGHPAPTAVDVADVREAINDRKNFKVTLDQNFHVKTMLEVAPDLVRYFALRTWTLVCFPTPSLLTSDVPVVLSNGGGVMTADEIVVAIDPGHALLMTHPGGHERIVSGTPEMAQKLNYATAGGAFEWIFHSPKHDPLDGLTLPPNVHYGPPPSLTEALTRYDGPLRRRPGR